MGILDVIWSKKRKVLSDARCLENSLYIVSKIPLESASLCRIFFFFFNLFTLQSFSLSLLLFFMLSPTWRIKNSQERTLEISLTLPLKLFSSKSCTWPIHKRNFINVRTCMRETETRNYFTIPSRNTKLFFTSESNIAKSTLSAIYYLVTII